MKKPSIKLTPFDRWVVKNLCLMPLQVNRVESFIFRKISNGLGLGSLKIDGAFSEDELNVMREAAREARYKFN